MLAFSAPSAKILMFRSDSGLGIEGLSYVASAYNNDARTKEVSKVRNHFGTFEVETVAHLTKTQSLHLFAECPMVMRDVERQKTTTTRSPNFPPQGAVLQRHVVEKIEFRLSHLRRDLLLVLPVLMELSSHLVQVPLLNSVQDTVA